MGYNGITIRDLLKNPKLSGLIPQFDKSTFLIDSDASIDKWISEYLAKALGGQITGDGEITVKGSAKVVLRRVNALKSVLEDFINNLPEIAENLKSNTKIYTPYVTTKQLKDASEADKKDRILKIVLENITYNPDIVNVRNKMQTQDFIARQKAWIKKVGYKVQQ